MIPIHRFDDQIQRLEQQPLEKGKILLYGSSFFANWGYERAKQQWYAASGLEVVNHGFGGATVEELLYYYHRLVLPYAPKAMVFRTAHNDVWSISAEECFLLTKYLFFWIQNDFPGIPLIAIKPFDTPSSPEKNLAEIHKYNALLDSFVGQVPWFDTVDINPFFRADDGSYRDIFLEDGLHLTDRGYEEMAQYLAPKIAELL